MSVDAVTLLFAMLAIGAEVLVVGAFLLGVGGRLSPSIARWRDDAKAVVGPQAIPIALVVATVATLGSLYLSEVAHFIPCKLCWYQRIAMYPLVPVFAIAAVRRDRHVWIYGAVISVIGALLAGYHVLIERYPSLDSGSCDPAAPCSLKWVEHFGYLTIPTMAGSAFVLILVLMLNARSLEEPHG